MDSISKKVDEINDLMTLEHVFNFILDKGHSYEIHYGKIRTYCPIHGEMLFRTLHIDIDEKTFKCSYTMCPGHHGGNLVTLYCLATNTPLPEAVDFWTRQLGIDHVVSSNPPQEPQETKTSLALKLAQTSLLQEDITIPPLNRECDNEKLLAALQREINRSYRYKRAMSIILLEVKLSIITIVEINTICKDDIYRRIRNLIVNPIRTVDMWVELKPGSYLILMPETTKDNAETVSRKLITEIQKFSRGLMLELSLEELPIQVDYGIAGLGVMKLKQSLKSAKFLQMAQEDLLRNQQLHLDASHSSV